MEKTFSKIKKLFQKIDSSSNSEIDSNIFNKKPFLKGHLVSFFSPFNVENAYLSDVLFASIFIKISRIEHTALEFANGQNTISEIVKLVQNKFPEEYSDLKSIEIILLNFFNKLHEEGQLITFV
jgi:hypothetical protein